jgi:hypothetical protein
MAKTPSKDIELHPDAWARFERAIGYTIPRKSLASERALVVSQFEISAAEEMASN